MKSRCQLTPIPVEGEHSCEHVDNQHVPWSGIVEGQKDSLTICSASWGDRTLRLASWPQDHFLCDIVHPKGSVARRWSCASSILCWSPIT